MKTCVVFLVCIVMSAAAFAREGTVINGDIGKQLDEAVQTQSGGFWGAVLVAHKGEILLSKGYGFADYGDTPNRPDTLFEIASTSKMFTGAGILKLEMQGKLSTDDPISKFLKDVPEDKKTITVFHLLTHTSGLSDAAAIPYNSEMSMDEFIKFTLESELDSKPGEVFTYNNQGYALLAAIIEIASGKSFEEYVKENIFKPAGMTDSGFINDESLDLKRDSRRYSEQYGSFYGSSARWMWSWGYRGMGGVVSTVTDLFKWHKVLAGEDVLDKKAKEKYFRPFKDNYACGVMVETTLAAGARQFHTGGVGGFRSTFARYPDEDAVVIILTNEGSDVFGIDKRLNALILGNSGFQLKLDLKGLKLNEHKAFQKKDGVEWKVEKKKAAEKIVVKICDSETHAEFAELTLSLKMANRLNNRLFELVREKSAAEVKAEDKTEVGVYLSKYEVPEDGSISFSEKIEVRITPFYRGVDENDNEVVDNRINLVIDDQAVGQWPLMALIGISDAKDLISKLDGALTQ